MQRITYRTVLATQERTVAYNFAHRHEGAFRRDFTRDAIRTLRRMRDRAR